MGRDPDQTIALIGMMGAGKTTVGKLLAERTGRRFFDSDAEIEARTGKTVAEIFSESGEEAFRDEEARSVCEALDNPIAVVMGVAGGAVMRAETREALAKNATVVWLRVPIETLIKRVEARHLERPMIANDPHGAMRRLYDEREPVYAEIADIVVEAGMLPPPGVVDLILEELDDD